MKRKHRVKINYDDRNNEGRSGNIMKFPGGINYYKAKEGEHNLLIVPYLVKSKNHPLVIRGKKEIDVDWDYVLTIDVHQNVGPEDNTIICLNKNFGKPCPLCESEGDIAKISTRAFYNIVDADNPKTGIQIFSVSAWLFQRELIDELKASSKGEEIIPFADPEEGRIISFRGAKAFGGGRAYTEYKSFKFIRRDEELNEMYEKERWEEQSISLDECMIILSYEEIEKILHGIDFDEEEKTDNDNKEKKSNEEREERVSRRRKVEENDEEEKTDNKCPYDHRFGLDFERKENNEDCDKCKVWDECDEEERRIRREKKEQRK